jgi:phage gp46-like protein
MVADRQHDEQHSVARTSSENLSDGIKTNLYISLFSGELIRHRIGNRIYWTLTNHK